MPKIAGSSGRTAMRCVAFGLFASVMVLLGGPVGSEAVIFGTPEGVQAGWLSTALFTNANNDLCTATIVGSQVALTSAACATTATATEAKPSVLKVRGEFYEVSCTPHPEYAQNPSLDFALCISPTRFKGVGIERVNSDPKRLTVDTKVFMVGYGCYVAEGIDVSSGRLGGGFASVRVVPQGTNAYAQVHGAALCFGDSGGGAYAVTGERVLLGINSRSDLRERSWLAATSVNAFQTWAAQWAALHGVAICGIQNTACKFLTEGGVPDRPLGGEDSLAVKWIGLHEAVVKLASNPIVVWDTPAQSGRSDMSWAVWQVVVKAQAGESLRDVVRRVCGPVRDEYFAKLKNVRGDKYDPDTRQTEAGEIGILPCPQLVNTGPVQEVLVSPGDTAWKYFVEVLAQNRKPAWREFERPSDASKVREAEYFLDAFRELNPGVDTKALPIGKTVRVPLVPVIARGSRIVVRTGADGIEPIFALQSSEAECGRPPDNESYPFNVGQVLDGLASNRWRAPGMRHGIARVLVADSGLWGVRQGVFRDSILERNKSMSWEDYEDQVRPWNDGPEPAHGTQVASLVLGGPMFARMQAVGEQRIGVVVRRIYQKNALIDRQWYGAVDQLWELINNAVAEFSVDVVNLSFKTRAELFSLKGQIVDARNRALFVAAAGNYDGVLGVGNDKAGYPALYGSLGAAGLVVVAALDAKGNVAPFSNRGAEYVDIAAPGCFVPALSYEVDSRGWTVERVNGTSVAAPLVSFTAALVRSEMERGLPIDLKRRLLVSSDLRSDLLSMIADGRVLNVAKAVSVFRDVVEVKEPNRLVFGEVTLSRDGQEIDALDVKCDGEAKSYPMKDIFKLVPLFKNKQGQIVTKLYYRAPGVFGQAECEPPTGVTVLVRDSERDVREGFRFDEVQDIVRKDLAPR